MLEVIMIGAYVAGVALLCFVFAVAPLYTAVRLTFDRPKKEPVQPKLPDFPDPQPLTIPTPANDSEALRFVRFSPNVAPTSDQDSQKRA